MTRKIRRADLLDGFLKAFAVIIVGALPSVRVGAVPSSVTELKKTLRRLPQDCKVQDGLSNRARLALPIKVKIVLSGKCGAEGNFDAIINGDERSPRTLKPELNETGEAVVSFSWSDEREVQFPQAPLFASLRLGRARTYCRIATEDRDNKLALTALFKFSCDEQAVHEVSIESDSSNESLAVPLTYARRIGMTPNPKGDGLDCASCVETGGLPGHVTVTDVRFPSEKLLLQFGLSEPDSEAPGLLVFSSNSDVPGLLTFLTDTKIGKVLVTGPNLKLKKPAKRVDRGLVITLTRREIGKNLFIKRGKNGDFSVAAIDLDDTVLDILTNLNLTAVAK